MFKGSTIKAFICMAGARDKMVGSCPSKARTCPRTSGMNCISCQVRVASKRKLLFRPTAVQEKKKVTANKFAFAHNSAMVWATADFPAPAGPYNHRGKKSPVLRVLLDLGLKDYLSCVRITCLGVKALSRIIKGTEGGMSIENLKCWHYLGRLASTEYIL